MPKKTYTEQFKRDAVALYENTPGASMSSMAKELGINRSTLKNWVGRFSSDPRAGSADKSETAAVTDAERIRQLQHDNARLREERDILRRAAKYFAEGDDLVSRFQFVDDTRTDYSVKRLCEILKIQRSSYYNWRDGAGARQQQIIADALLTVRIRAIFDAENGCYGAKRITAELNDPHDSDGAGTSSESGSSGCTPAPVNHKRVARLMRANGLAGYTKKRRVKTTIADKRRRVFADLLRRQFTAKAVNDTYVGDITYLPIADGSNMYLATVIDCFSRRLVGFAIADHMRTELVQEALVMAKTQRGSVAGAIFHSDHGSVYTSGAFQDTCRTLGVRQSMGAIGTSADNALAESFNAALKREVLQDQVTFANQLVCRRDVFRWCVRYNTARRHSWCGNLSPQAYEARGSGSLRFAS
ncbi:MULTISPECIES: IS3 family transposase [unclassified Corynebacterium]|uniref:IS3 family transposase n=1 Tax=unclassified Corynebacterium TaxID=2624378 RepID=UPI0040342A7A